MKICVLASSSAGNCTLVSDNGTNILIDAGISTRKMKLRLAEMGLGLPDIDAVFITHEHIDHVRGIKGLLRYSQVPVFLNHATLETLGFHADGRFKPFSTGAPISIGKISVESFSVPHDAVDPCGYALRMDDKKAVVVTDVGHGTQLLRQKLKDARAMVLEANHDVRMLHECEYPWQVKQRILSKRGHLSNESTRDVLAEVAHPELCHVLLAHLSDDNNTPDLALETIKPALNGGLFTCKISVAPKDTLSEIVEF